MWLRFNCSCPKCKDPSTNMTRYDLTTIPIDMTMAASKSGRLITQLFYYQYSTLTRIPYKLITHYSRCDNLYDPMSHLLIKKKLIKIM